MADNSEIVETSTADDKMFLSPEEMDALDTLDEHEEEFLRPLLRGWFDVVKIWKKERAAQEAQLRAMMRKNNRIQQLQGRKLMVAVTFHKWIEYLEVVKIEKKEILIEQKQAVAALSAPTKKPTREMLRRRNSVMGTRILTQHSNGSPAGKEHSFFMPMMLMIEEREKIRQSYEAAYKGKKQIAKEKRTKLEVYKLLRNRQKHALSIVSQEKERLVMQSCNSHNFDPYFLMKIGEGMGINNLTGLPLPSMPKLKKKKKRERGNWSGEVDYERLEVIMNDVNSVRIEGDFFLAEVERQRNKVKDSIIQKDKI